MAPVGNSIEPIFEINRAGFWRPTRIGNRWIFYGLVLLAVCLAQLKTDWQRQEVQFAREWIQKLDDIAASEDLIASRLIKMFKDDRYSRARLNIERLLNDRKPFARMTRNGEQVSLLFEPISGIEVAELQFDSDDQLIEYRWTWPGSSYRTTLPEPSRAWWRDPIVAIFSGSDLAGGWIPWCGLWLVIFVSVVRIDRPFILLWAEGLELVGVAFAMEMWIDLISQGIDQSIGRSSTYPAEFIVCMIMLVASMVIHTVVFRKYGRKPRQWMNRRCQKCDYDLTGNQSGICPECGTNIHAELLAAAR